jgi:hypothetical protein
MVMMMMMVITIILIMVMVMMMLCKFQGSLQLVINVLNWISLTW